MATAQNESLLKNTRSMLRSVLLSAPRGVRARNLEAEYRGITGKMIPYRELGYKSLKDFMNTLQDVARLSTAEGEPVYHGVADSSTVHIAKMVAKQKKPKKKSQPLYNSTRGNQRQSRGGGHYKGICIYTQETYSIIIHCCHITYAWNLTPTQIRIVWIIHFIVQSLRSLFDRSLLKYYQNYLLNFWPLNFLHINYFN